jgi:hypothetical protein
MQPKRQKAPAVPRVAQISNVARLGGLPITALFCAAFLLGQIVPGAPVRIAFLKDDAILQDTISILREHGCGEVATGGFRKAVQQYHATQFEFDCRKFPAEKNGFYSFATMSRFVGALPHKLYETDHPYEFNCFDTVIRLGAPTLTSTAQPDDLLSGLLTPYQPTNGPFSILPVATARDAFTRCYPEWYRTMSSNAFDGSELNKRIGVTASLFRCYVLPLSTTEDKLATAVLATLRSGWRATGLQLPKRAELVLCHQVNYPQRWVATVHAGWLMPKKHGFAYIEKSGGKGPFVRLDIEDKADLTIWFEAMFQGAEKLGYTHHFTTFNDSGIETVSPPRAEENRW